MLTFILLVVLAGGVGLIAVSSAERNDPATPWSRTRRGQRTAHHDDEGPGEPATTIQDGGAVEPISVVAPATTEGPPRRRNRGPVPARVTAVEGAFEVVALPSPSRRMLSLGLIVALVVVVALVIAGIIGAAGAILGRLVDGAIG